MMRWWFWSILALIPNLIFAVKSSDDPFGGAICENTVSAFFVSDNTNVVWEGKVLLIDNITEDQCKEVCINNKDLKGRSILCASFTYDHVSFQCNIYRHRSLPDGTMARQYSPGKRYFEKFCIAEDLPVECANTMFIRADESIIKGYAKNTSIVPSMEECASRCLREEFDCKSAMYFYEEGECITNIESAMTKPEDFGHPDDGDRVVYFQNGCTREFINTLGQDSAKPIESETLFESTTTEESVSTTEEVKAEETEAPSTTTEAPVETTEKAVEEKPVKPRKNKGSRRRGSAEIGSEEAPVPDQAEQELQPAEPSATSVEIPPKEFPPSHPRKIKADSSEKSPPKPKKSHDSAEEEEKEPESIPQEPEAELTTEQPESSTGALKDMEKELLELLNESSAAAADLGNDESDQEEQEKPQPKKAVSKKSKKKGEAKHKSSDEEALKEMQEIREMLKNRKEKNREDDDKQRKVKAHDEEEQEAQSEEVTQEPTTKRPKSSKRKQHRSEEEEEPKPREQEEEEVKEKAVEEEEKPLERKPKSEESVEEEQQEARPRQRSSKTNGVKKPLYAAKQLRHMSDGSLREISKEQEAKPSEEAEPRRPKDPSPEEGHREPLPTAAPEKEELKAIRPTRVRKLGLKLNGEPRKINIRPLRTQSGEDGHDFTDPARERAQEDQQEERDEVDGYFSKWGDWTKCTHPGERRLRRRKCLDLKKCKGSLMQVSYCPKDLPAEVAPSQEPQEEQPRQSAAEDEPARPVRKPLPVEGVSSESGHPPGIMPPEMPEKETKPLPVGAPGNSDEVWSPWLGVCQQFASTQPCKNGKVIGFESRECVAKDPKLCKGPFFRYCTLKC